MRSMVILAVLAIGCGRQNQTPDMRGMQRRVAADLRAIDTAIGEFFLECAECPHDLNELAKPNYFGKVLVEAKYLRDPWGSPYQYDRNGPKNTAAGIRVKPDVWCSRDGWTIGNFTHFKVER